MPCPSTMVVISSHVYRCRGLHGHEGQCAHWHCRQSRCRCVNDDSPLRQSHHRFCSSDTGNTVGNCSAVERREYLKLLFHYIFAFSNSHMEICQFQALVDPFEGKRSRLLFESANCKVLHLIAGYQLRCSASYFNGIIVFVINDIERKSCYCIAHRDNQRIVSGEY